jgi:hypothetical protein
VDVACTVSTEVNVVAPTGSSVYSSNVAIVDQSTQSCKIRVSCTDNDSAEETWQFESSHCVDSNGRPAACANEIRTPTQLKVKVKRQPVYTCPA